MTLTLTEAQVQSLLDQIEVRGKPGHSPTVPRAMVPVPDAELSEEEPVDLYPDAGLRPGTEKESENA